MTVSTESAENTVSNDLHGVDIATATSALGTGSFYVLGNKNSHFGFHKYEGQTMAARKAYLLLSGSQAAHELTMVFEENETTGIQEHELHESHESVGAWCTIDGRKLVGKPTKKGLYIHNGRKEVVK